jgi:hypothetical protein
MIKDFDPIDWEKYNKPPYLQSWMGKGDTLSLVKFGDKNLSDVNEQILKLKDAWDIDKLAGLELDRMGKLVERWRRGYADPQYRTLLKIKIMLNTADGTYNDIIKIVKMFYDADLVEIVPQYPARIVIRHSGEGDALIDFNSVLKEVVGAGIGYGTVEVITANEELPALEHSDVIVKPLSFELVSAQEELAMRLDGFNFFDRFSPPLLYDGTWLYDGSEVFDGMRDDREFTEALSVRVQVNVTETVTLSEQFAGTIGRADSETVTAIDADERQELSVMMDTEELAADDSQLGLFRRHHLFYDGTWLYDGSEIYDSMVLTPVPD